MPPSSVAERTATPGTAAAQLEARIVDAMLDCIGRWGIGKTTADDIARRAGISRATLYRAFPGGKDVAFEALLRHETARFFDAVTEPLARATTLEDTVAIGFVEAARFVEGHEPLQYLLTHEPERVLPSFAVTRLDRTFAIATAFTTPLLRPYVADDDAAAVGAEWLVRQFFSYVLVPTPALVLTDEAAVRRFVRTFIVPALTP
jgi:AcrR family transcriptional regulator